RPVGALWVERVRLPLALIEGLPAQLERVQLLDLARLELLDPDRELVAFLVHRRLEGLELLAESARSAFVLGDPPAARLELAVERLQLVRAGVQGGDRLLTPLELCAAPGQAVDLLRKLALALGDAPLGGKPRRQTLLSRGELPFPLVELALAEHRGLADLGRLAQRSRTLAVERSTQNVELSAEPLDRVLTVGDGGLTDVEVGDRLLAAGHDLDLGRG